jgi:hypothetical protein
LPSHDTTYKPSDKIRSWIVKQGAILYGWNTKEVFSQPLVGHTGLVITLKDTARWNRVYIKDTTYIHFDAYDFDFGEGDTEEDPGSN